MTSAAPRMKHAAIDHRPLTTDHQRGACSVVRRSSFVIRRLSSSQSAPSGSSGRATERSSASAPTSRPAKIGPAKRHRPPIAEADNPFLYQVAFKQIGLNRKERKEREGSNSCFALFALF